LAVHSLPGPLLRLCWWLISWLHLHSETLSHNSGMCEWLALTKWKRDASVIWCISLFLVVFTVGQALRAWPVAK
jgi:hypothetical protein